MGLESFPFISYFSNRLDQAMKANIILAFLAPFADSVMQLNERFSIVKREALNFVLHKN